MSFLLLIVGSCKEDPPVQPPPQPDNLAQITLALVGVDFTAVVLRVTFPDSIGSWTLSLHRDSKPIHFMTVFGRDTLLKDEGLEPSRTYTYQAVRLIDSTTVREKSNELLVRTKEVTSSAFQWRIDSLAGYTSSTLYDVAILNDTLVYAVGELYKFSDIQRYNLAVWNGKIWSLQRIIYYHQGIPTYPVLYAVFAFGESNIWFGGEGIYHWDGRDYSFTGLPPNWGPNRILKIWGSSSSDVYIVGDNGSIAHYNGSVWRKIESGTTLPIRDIYGAKKAGSDEYEILCVADSYMKPDGSQVLTIDKDKVSVVWNDRRQFGLDGIWFIPENKYFVVGDGFWETTNLSEPFVRKNVLEYASKASVHGNNENDMVICGSFLLFGHFNGLNWKPFFPNTPGAFGTVKMKGDIVVAVGLIGRYACAAIGRR